MRLTMVIATLGAGGAERVMSLLANHWAGMGWQISLITLERSGKDFFSLDNRINRVGLDLMGQSNGPLSAVSANMARVLNLRQAIKASRPELILSFMDRTNVLTLLACRGMRIPVVVSERSNPYQQPAGKAFGKLRKKLYPKAAAVVVNCPEAADYLGDLVAGERLFNIPNPLLMDDHSDPGSIMTELPDKHSVIGLGRFTWEKGFDLLIRAFAQANQDNPGWRLFLLGQGPLGADLKDLAQDLGIREQVVFCGQVQKPQVYLSHAGLFVLPSRFEGFPNGLAEAMACGLACVATSCSGSVAEMMPPKSSFFMVPVDDESAMSRSMSRLMAADQARKALGHLNRKASERYALPRIAQRWQDLFLNLAPAKD
jgi:GalNAc-alpha-(1->4)-GalNAc-alpha-(1->3)-diNAcBac-PP-undecaprenol alpha-1,4-N-acetyl-D-galactosaminyltransferase